MLTGLLKARPTLVTRVRTHQGMVRANNEDEAVVVACGNGETPWASGVLVADGMGGGSAGEMASQMVAGVLQSRLKSWRVDDPALLGGSWATQFRKHLVGVVEDAHRALRSKATQDPSLEGMGSTLALALAFRDCCAVVSCGDSRVYRWRKGTLNQLTNDQTWDEDERRKGELSDAEILASPYVGRLTQVLGGTAPIRPAVNFIRVMKGDTILVCSDGLTKHVPPHVLTTLLAEKNPDALTAKLVAAALEAGGSDNIAVGVLRAAGTPDGTMPVAHDEWSGPSEVPVSGGPHAGEVLEPRRASRPTRRARRRRVAALSLLAAGVLGATGATYWALQPQGARQSWVTNAGGVLLSADAKGESVAVGEITRAEASAASASGKNAPATARSKAAQLPGMSEPAVTPRDEVRAGPSGPPLVTSQPISIGSADSITAALRDSLEALKDEKRRNEAEAREKAETQARLAAEAKAELEKREACDREREKLRARREELERDARQLRVWDSKASRVDQRQVTKRKEQMSREYSGLDDGYPAQRRRREELLAVDSDLFRLNQEEGRLLNDEKTNASTCKR